MKPSKAGTVEAYLAALSVEKRAALNRLRRMIRSIVPKAEERISYGIPAFYFDGRMLVAYGAAAKHCSFYPGAVVQSLNVDLKGYDTAKGTIRFPVDGPLPAALVRKIVKMRIAANAAKTAKRRARSTILSGGR